MQISPAVANDWNKARELIKSARYAQAIDLFRSISRKIPSHPHLWAELGAAAMRTAEIDLAAKAYRKSLECCGLEIPLMLQLGRAFAGLRLMDDARSCYERALQVQADSVPAIAEMVRMHERDGRLEEARAILAPVLTSHASNEQVRYFDAFLDQRSGHIDSAESKLRDLLATSCADKQVWLMGHHLLADLLDTTERPDEAMQFLHRVKSSVLANPEFRNLFASYDAGVAQRRQLLEKFTTEQITAWQKMDPALSNDARVTFLGGHPRSGTTLLERVLDAHPDLTAFDEPLAFYHSVDPFLRKFGADHPDLVKQPARYRERLLWEVGGRCESKVLLDKNPSLTAALHSWLRAFPGIRVIIALRHPLDVMLSCFFINTPINSLSSNFLSLERISKHYRDMMDVWLRLRDLGGFEWIESKYEDTVENVAGEGRRVTEFLGLDWRDEQAEFHRHKQQTHVVAPTYHDVTKPVYQTSMQRWRRYESHLAPHIDELRPYMERLGYDV